MPSSGSGALRGHVGAQAYRWRLRRERGIRNDWTVIVDTGQGKAPHVLGREQAP